MHVKLLQHILKADNDFTKYQIWQIHARVSTRSLAMMKISKGILI